MLDLNSSSFTIISVQHMRISDTLLCSVGCATVYLGSLYSTPEIPSYDLYVFAIVVLDMQHIRKYLDEILLLVYEYWHPLMLPRFHAVSSINANVQISPVSSIFLFPLSQ